MKNKEITVIIDIEGGVATVVKKDKGVKVILIDSERMYSGGG